MENSAGEWVTRTDAIAQVLVGYYECLLGRANNDVQPVSIEELGSILVEILPRSRADDLCKKVSSKEVKAALFSMPDDKSPVCDRFNSCFYKSPWSIIGGDITHVVRHVFSHVDYPKASLIWMIIVQ
ncbi:hypothetical protein LINGRAPRIM_LOCUS137, partial [Linum grandiflorum]